jgi:three-Cys-motif partner protein
MQLHALAPVRVNTMTHKGKKKTNEEFFDERLSSILEWGKNLKQTNPECTDEYNDHSILKLICINYWLGIFLPICDKQLRQKFHYKIAYIDTMAGCGVTSSKRENDCFCGSCPGAIISSQLLEIPFDLVVGVELDANKATILESRLKTIITPEKVQVINNDINAVSSQIANFLQNNRTVSYMVIDPQALQGMTWGALKPLLTCKGDAMVTWFEIEAWRVRSAAVSESNHAAAKAEIIRLNELLGEGWRQARTPEELTQIFINRVLSECEKQAYAKVYIPRQPTGYYWMILFTGKFNEAQKLASEWENNVKKRIESSHGKDISSLLDVKSGRQSSLF